MRVLWFTNVPLLGALKHLGHPPFGSGQWMSCMLESLVERTDIQVEVATAHPGFEDAEFESKNVRYHIFGQPRYLSIFSARDEDLHKCVDLVKRCKPDLIHIHGSERFFGLLAARKLVDTPAVISIQGLVDSCVPIFFGALTPSEIWKSHRLIELLTKRGPIWRYRDFVKGAALGRQILAGAQNFMGRTAWDYAHLKMANPTAHYYECGELLRRPFSEARWDLNRCRRRSIIFTNGGSEPRRGIEVLLRATAAIRREFPDTILRIGGDIGIRRGYDRFLRRMVEELGLAAHVEFLGYLSAERMAHELAQSHIFVQPSFMENSSISLCEAMQVGMPCAAAYAGGMPSTVEHGRTGCLFPPGDAALLAQTVLELFRNGDRAQQLGRAARETASWRHSPERVISQLLAAYSSVAGVSVELRNAITSA